MRHVIFSLNEYVMLCTLHQNTLYSYILSLLFRILLKYSVVPDSFRYGVVVPLVKILIVTVLCLIITEVLQLVQLSVRFLTLSLLMSLFQDQLSSDHLQFGFKKN